MLILTGDACIQVISCVFVDLRPMNFAECRFHYRLLGTIWTVFIRYSHKGLSAFKYFSDSNDACHLYLFIYFFFFLRSEGHYDHQLALFRFFFEIY